MVSRLEPIEKPDGLKMRFVYWMMRRKFGKVMTPLKVVTARIPGSLGLNRKFQKFHANGIQLALLNARWRRGGVSKPPLHNVKRAISRSDDAVAVADDVPRTIREIASSNSCL